MGSEGIPQGPISDTLLSVSLWECSTSALLGPSLTYHRRRVKLRDDVMEENRQVSRARFQRVQALKRATFSINLMERQKRGISPP